MKLDPFVLEEIESSQLQHKEFVCIKLLNSVYSEEMKKELKAVLDDLQLLYTIRHMPYGIDLIIFFSTQVVNSYKEMNDYAKESG